MLLSVVIPSYNEMGNLRKGILDHVEYFLENKKSDYEVIIVDDGSKDGSLEFVKKFVERNNNFRIIQNKHMGKAAAVTTGVLAAKGDYILFTDMDQATPIDEVDKLLSHVPKYDIVIGSRSSARKGSPIIRILISRSSVILRKIIVGMGNVTDTQCGFKLFSKKAAHEIFTKLHHLHHGFRSIKTSSVTSGFDIELLYIGTSLGYKIREVPVDWLYVETRRVNPVKDSVDGVIELLRIKKNIVKGIYK